MERAEESQRYTFLVIDDNPGDVAFLWRQLREIKDWEVELTAFRDLEAFQKEPAGSRGEVIFVDNQLEVKTGLEISEAIRCAGDERPIIILTEQKDELSHAAAIEAGADDFLVKGHLDPGLLRRAITSVIQKHKLRRGGNASIEQLEPSRKMETPDVFTGGGKSKAASEALPRGSETLLVVDDEHMVRELTVEMLERLGYRPFLAFDGQMAIETYMAMKDEIDAVLLDLCMPRMDGRECLARLKEIDPEVRVLFASGHDLEQETECLLKQGAKGIIQKPFRLSDLAYGVRNLLDNRTCSPDCFSDLVT